MMRLKGCPRCHGDMVLEEDIWGQHWSCFACGCSVEIVNGKPQVGTLPWVRSNRGRRPKTG